MSKYRIIERDKPGFELRVGSEPRGVYTTREEAIFYGELYASMAETQHLLTAAAAEAPLHRRFWYTQVPNGMWVCFDTTDLRVMGFEHDRDSAKYWAAIYEDGAREGSW